MHPLRGMSHTRTASYKIEKMFAGKKIKKVMTPEERGFYNRSRRAMRTSACMKTLISIDKQRDKKIAQILKKSEKIAKLVNSGWRDADDVLKVMDFILEHDNFMQELAVMKIDYEKHLKPHHRHVGLA